MQLYDYDFCHNLLYAGWDGGIVNNLNDARHEILQNFDQMDFENASAYEEMREIVEGMVAEIDQLLSKIQSVQFK